MSASDRQSPPATTEEPHSLLQKQLRLSGIDPSASEAMGTFVRMVDNAYKDMDRLSKISSRASEVMAMKLTHSTESMQNVLAALNVADDGIGIIGADNRVTYANQAMKDLFAALGIKALIGYPLDEIRVAGAPLLPPEFMLRIDSSLRRNKRWRGQITLRSAMQGPPRLITARLRLLPNGGRVAVVSDITEARRREEETLRLERQLEQSRKLEALGKVAGGVVHDFNNLLGAILGFAQFIAEDTPDTAPIHRYASRILTAGRQAKSLISQILSFARHQSQTPDIIEISAMAGEVIGILRAMVPPTIAMAADIRDTGLNIQMVRTELIQVLSNLIVNAAEAMTEPEGRITIAVERLYRDPPEIRHLLRAPTSAKLDDGGTLSWTSPDGVHHVGAGILRDGVAYVRLSVVDTGCGMELGVARQAFTPFFSTKGTKGGTGLGLAVVQSVVFNAGGCLLLSTRPGKGSRFSVLLALSENPVEGHSQPEEQKNTRAWGNILLIEDNAAFGDMLSLALQRLGYEVTICQDAAEGLAQLDRAPMRWNLVITDQSLASMDGTKLVVEVKRRRHDLPCVICTGDLERLGELAAQGMEADGLVAKPIDIGPFSTLIRSLIAPWPERGR